MAPALLGLATNQFVLRLEGTPPRHVRRYSAAPPTESLSGRASSSNSVSACAPCTASPHGWRPRAREARALRSLVNHREGLCVFVDRPFVPLDNNVAERILRAPAIGRRLSHGSDSEKGAEFATDEGEALIGRVLDTEQVCAVRQSFGLDSEFAMTGEEAFEAVMGRGTALPLANGWRLARRRIMGADRIEIEGPADGDTDALKRMGCPPSRYAA